MAEITDKEEQDKDLVDIDILEQQFSKKYKLLTEKSVSLKKSYINKLCATKSLKVAVSQPDHSIEVYQLTDSSLGRVCRLSGHPKGLTEVVACPKDEHMLYSCGSDGTIKLWDTRDSGSCVQEYKGEDDDPVRPLECMSVSCVGRVLCGGSALVQDDAFLVFWDPRQPHPLGGYWNSHSDDVTQVRFHPTKPSTLCSGAADGFVNVYDIQEATEDDALAYSIGVEDAVERLSWLDDARVACLKQANELRVCDAASGDLVASYGREKVAKGIRRSKSDDCYLVDAFSSIDDSPILLAGSYGGNGEVLRSVAITEKRLQPSANFADNKQVVRCCWYDKSSDLLVTAGEAGIVSVWRGSERTANGGEHKLTASLNKLHVNRYKPY